MLVNLDSGTRDGGFPVASQWEAKVVFSHLAAEVFSLRPASLVTAKSRSNYGV